MISSNPKDTVAPHLRPARQDDADRLLAWRNHPSSRAMYGDTAEVDVAVHKAWLERKLKDADSRLFIAEVDGEATGYVRFDAVAPDVCEVSISIAPDHRGRGLATSVLRQGCDSVRRIWPGRAITARVKLDNESSNRLFRTCNFEETARDHEMIYYSLSVA